MFSSLPVTGPIVRENLATHTSIKAAFLFLALCALYFFSRSPGLDEIDSVNFAMGVLHFDLWQHQPHPPGYPLFIFLGWLGLRIFGASPELSLHFVSAVGGALFVVAWFLIIRLQFNERLGWWVASCLAITPGVWMIATKVLTDSLAAGLMSAEILAAAYFLRNKRAVALFSASILGAAAAGARPQLFLVVLVILITTLRFHHARMKVWLTSIATLIAGCLVWLLPMWYIQSRLRPEVAAGVVYPKLVYVMWAGRLHKPGMYLFAGDWSPKYLGVRFAEHFLGWFGVGFGFIYSWTALAVGTAVVLAGLAAYLFQIFENKDRQFWKYHSSWAFIHIATIFISLPSTQRYYLVIYPLLLVALLRGFLELPRPWNWSAWTLPAVLLLTAVPIAITNHRDETPPLRMVRYLEELYPPSARGQVILLLSTRSKRHAEWYAPEFKTINPIPPAAELAEITKNAVAVYTDESTAPLPPGWYRIPLVAFRRSPIIYRKAHFMELYFVGRGNGS